MKCVEAEGFPGILLLEGTSYHDSRGHFTEVWRADVLDRAGASALWVQENRVLSTLPGTLRGMHFQVGEAAQAKLITCLSGRLLDVAVDLRPDTSSYGRVFVLELSAERPQQLYLPIGFAHGYLTLEPNTLVQYKVSAYYDPSAERGFCWNDPEVGIPWPDLKRDLVISPKDASLPPLSALSCHPSRVSPSGP